jgi:hypothetical protein
LSQFVRDNAFGLNTANISTVAAWQGNSNAPGSLITVQVTYQTQGVTGMFWPGQTFNLRGQSSMIIQN